MQVLGLSSLVLVLALSSLEFQKLVVMLDVEQKRCTLHIASIRLNRLCRYDLQLLGALAGLDIFAVSYAAALTALLFVYELRKRGGEKFTVSALDFFEHRRERKTEMIARLSIYLFLLCKCFLSLLSRK
jgi:hypothetical protein